MKNQKGFTLVEIILVLVLITISMGFSLLYYQTSQVRADINSQVANFASELRLLQTKANSGKNNSSYGVYLQANSYTTFEGSSYNANNNTNKQIALPSIIEIQNINLNGGGNSIIFNPPHGESGNYGSIDFVSDQINKSITVTISNIGTVNY